MDRQVQEVIPYPELWWRRHEIQAGRAYLQTVSGWTFRMTAAVDPFSLKLHKPLCRYSSDFISMPSFN